MTTRSKRNEGVAAGSETWVAQISKSIDSIGTEKFPTHLVDALKSLVSFDYSVVFAFHQSEKPLCLFHTFRAEQQVVFVENYLMGPYLLDPIFKACIRKVDTALYRLSDSAPDRFYQSEYYRSYYIQTGLAEEIYYPFYLPNNVAVSVSLMRSGESSRFSSREFKLLNSVTPIIVSLAQRHWQSVSELFEVDTTSSEPLQDRELIETMVGDLFGDRITPRETQVIAQVLEGHSSESISKNLKISAGTVRIHRRNIYAKLRISSQHELFTIFLKNITMGRS
jgi:DNA-binding CsgD family transcriptional regulator